MGVRATVPVFWGGSGGPDEVFFLEKGCEFLLVSQGRGLGSGSGGVVGGGFPVENEGEGEEGWGGWGVGWGPRKGTGKSVRELCRNYPLANYLLVSFKIHGNSFPERFFPGIKSPKP